MIEPTSTNQARAEVNRGDDDGQLCWDDLEDCAADHPTIRALGIEPNDMIRASDDGRAFVALWSMKGDVVALVELRADREVVTGDAPDEAYFRARSMQGAPVAITSSCRDALALAGSGRFAAWQVAAAGGVDRLPSVARAIHERLPELGIAIVAGADPDRERAVAESLGAQFIDTTAKPTESSSRVARPWPEPLDAAAFHGLAGDIVRAIEPHSEADPAALLIQTIIAFGATVGRGPHVRIEGDEHHANLFAVVVGDTAKARKGTSWGRVREIFGALPEWPRVVEGLSSGEGLKYAVRDQLTKIEKGALVVIDPGVADKRLLVTESEFAQVLRQGARAGNTLSPTTRAAWDTGALAALTRNDPITATGAHISIIGHITAPELRAELTATDAANGFANRFLFICARRSKILPFGGGALNLSIVAALRERVTRAVERARSMASVEMSHEARRVWARVYATLSEGHPGLLGAVTARAEAQCVRLALVYALMDGADQIDGPHLSAALAVWDRAEASARYIFGDALGDPIADEVLRALRAAGSAGLTRTAIRDLFRRNQSS